MLHAIIIIFFSLNISITTPTIKEGRRGRDHMVKSWI